MKKARMKISFPRKLTWPVAEVTEGEGSGDMGDPLTAVRNPLYDLVTYIGLNLENNNFKRRITKEGNRVVYRGRLPLDIFTLDIIKLLESNNVRVDGWPSYIRINNGDVTKKVPVGVKNRKYPEVDPETGDFVKDPSTQSPLLDPETGDPVLDPETNEPVLDPDTGSPNMLVHTWESWIAENSSYLAVDGKAYISTAANDGVYFDEKDVVKMDEKAGYKILPISRVPQQEVSE